MTTPIVQVALDLPLAKNFDFLAPGVTVDDVGRLVTVPFGSRKLPGVIVGIVAESDVPPDKLRAVLHVQRGLPRFSAQDFALFRFCEAYYHHPLGTIALNAVPVAMRATRLVAPKSARAVTLTDAGREALRALSPRAVAQRAMLQAIEHAPQAEAVLKSRHERAAAVLRTLIDKGWAAIGELGPVATTDVRGAPVFAAGPELNAGQADALARIAATLGRFAPHVIAGITGSGKTEVYLRVIEEALKRGWQALVLVPEINLTPQFLRQIAARFPTSHIVQQHSGLAEMPRFAGYLDAQAGTADIVIGTRLAVFTPLPRLGVIVVDEEHDASFKQQEGFRYSARDVAVFRAQQSGCPVVLGSATPSLETVHNVARGRFNEIRLTRRATANALLPKVGFIDLNSERAGHGLTPTMIEALKETVTRGEQALVFINRRGYAPALVCAQCGWMPDCTRCSARLVFHQKERRLKCHHCGYQTRVPAVCADCGSHDLTPAGQGTERVEAALREALPAARIARVDRDSTRRRGSAEKIFDAAAAGELDVLVGTQMLAKGHDFPRITLVGVINADGAVFSADFRAAERMVAQLMQVAGRAGRADLPGRVLIQTRFASHPLYQAVAAQDYAQFATLAMSERKVAHLPPYTFLALLRAESRDAGALEAFMRLAVELARAQHAPGGLHVWDAVPAPLSRKAGYERKQLMVQAVTRGALQQFLAQWLAVLREQPVRAVKWAIDVDPQDV